MTVDPVVGWLLEGDPAIRWQVMRDLLDEQPEAWEAERRRTAEEGWAAEMQALHRSARPRLHAAHAGDR